MPPDIYKRKSPVQEKLARIKDIILKDALSREKSSKELAKIYGVHYMSLLKYYGNNGIKKKRKKVEYKSGYTRDNYKSRIEDLRSYIKENDITKTEIIQVIILALKEG